MVEQRAVALSEESTHFSRSILAAEPYLPSAASSPAYVHAFLAVFLIPIFLSRRTAFYTRLLNFFFTSVFATNINNFRRRRACDGNRFAARSIKFPNARGYVLLRQRLGETILSGIGFFSFSRVCVGAR